VQDIWLAGDAWISRINLLAWLVLAATILACLSAVDIEWLLVLCIMIASATIFQVWRLNHLVERVRNRRTYGLASFANGGLIALTCFAPIFLALTAMRRFELVDWQSFLVVAMVFGMPVAYLLTHFLSRKKVNKIGTALISCFFCYSGPGSLIWSSLQFANAVGSPVLIDFQQSKILEMHAQKGSRRHHTYAVTFETPPYLNGITWFELDSKTFNQLARGKTACVEVWRGNLRVRWYKVTRCVEIQGPPTVP
jgi:hypothetical protein